jgi:hypothetical protein
MEIEVDEQRRAELEACLILMQQASTNFYRQAVHCGNHAFIEFTGLMNEYIKVCRTALNGGQDFAMANIHTGQALPFAQHHIDYLSEKLNCIYGASISELVVHSHRSLTSVDGISGTTYSSIALNTESKNSGSPPAGGD